MSQEKQTDKNSPSASQVALGNYLAAIRKGRDLTLRQVEDATEKVVSNAYLSQIENGRIQQPSPNILLALADLYGVDYAALMERAGYVTKTDKSRGDSARHGRAATFADQNLTDEEESKLLEYLGFLRHNKR